MFVDSEVKLYLYCRHKSHLFITYYHFNRIKFTNTLRMWGSVSIKDLGFFVERLLTTAPVSPTAKGFFIYFSLVDDSVLAGFCF